jgi:tetratricopeptide (TPR) repeat protein
MAGDRNRAIHAYDQAINDYKRALDLIELGEGKEGEKADLLEKLAGCCNLAGHAQDSVRYYQQALSLDEKLHDFKACARISVDLSYALFRAKPTGTQEGIPVLRRALKYVEGDPESYEAAAVYSYLASWLWGLTECDEATTLADKALEAGEKSGNFAVVVQTFQTKAGLLWESGRIDECLQLLEKALDLGLQHSLHVLTGNVLLTLSVYTYSRDFAKGREFALRQVDLAKREYVIPAQAGSVAWLSYLDWLKGDWVVALDGLERALGMAQRLGFTNDPVQYGEVCKGLALLSMGDIDQAAKYLENSSVKQNPQTMHVVAFNLAMGKVRLDQGRDDEAKTYFETCVDKFKKSEFSPILPHQIEALVHLASIYTKHGRLGEARKMSEWAKRIAETLKGDACFALASQAEASLLFATGDRKGAEEAYLKSLDLWERAGWPYYQAKALVSYSEIIAQTNPDESKKRLEQAAEIFKKLGAKRDLHRAESRLQS